MTRVPEFISRHSHQQSGSLKLAKLEIGGGDWSENQHFFITTVEFDYGEVNTVWLGNLNVSNLEFN